MRRRYQTKRAARVGFARRPQKFGTDWFVAALIIISLFLSLYGMLSSVKIWPNVYSDFMWFGLFLCIPCMVVFLIVVKNSENTVFERIKIFSAFLIILPIIFVLMFAKAIPSLLHHLVSQPAEMQFVVQDKASGKGCGYGFHTKDFDQFFNDEFCGLNREAYMRIRAGNIVVMHGTRSVYGFSPTGKYYVMEGATRN